jgi:hypothetical protein
VYRPGDDLLATYRRLAARDEGGPAGGIAAAHSFAARAAVLLEAVSSVDRLRRLRGGEG